MTTTMTSAEPPGIEPDASHVQISAEPPSGYESGSHTFGRLITAHLQSLLRTPIDAPVYRENPFGRRPCARAQSYEFTTAGHQVRIVYFEYRPDWCYDSLPGYAVFLGDQRLPFDPATYREIEWQIARTLWIAVTDRQIAAERAARTLGDAA
jgi:hypothetical protein